MTIKHLVISGGGPVMIKVLSSIQHLINNDFLNMANVETIYGTSAGVILAVMLVLKFEWKTINDYIIKRPWQDVFPINIQDILNTYSKKGIFDNKNIEKCFKPLFDAKDIPMNINMEEFYKLTNVEIHAFSFEVNDYKLYDISYKTHPTLSVITAIQMSCALPIIITPVCFDDKCFMDGGVACNYPLNFCIDSGKCVDEILGFKNKYSNGKSNINIESTLLDYIMTFLFKSMFHIHDTSYIQPIIKNEVIFNDCSLNLDAYKNALCNIEFRRELFEIGKLSAIRFLELITK